MTQTTADLSDVPFGRGVIVNWTTLMTVLVFFQTFFLQPHLRMWLKTLFAKRRDGSGKRKTNKDIPRRIMERTLLAGGLSKFNLGIGIYTLAIYGEKTDRR